MFADDTQLYSHSELVRNVSALLSSAYCLYQWTCHIIYASHRLQLNAAKTEFILFGFRSALSKIPQQFRQLTVGTSTAQSSNVVRDLGVHFDSELTMKRHVSKVVSVCYYQLWKLHHLWRLVNQTVLKQVVTSFVLSRTDYCNSLLINLPIHQP